jgi:hypothetical protein
MITDLAVISAPGVHSCAERRVTSPSAQWATAVGAVVGGAVPHRGSSWWLFRLVLAPMGVGVAVGAAVARLGLGGWDTADSGAG